MPTRAMDEHEEHQVGKVTEMSPKLRCRWASEDSEYQRCSGVEAGHRARSQLHEHETQVAREMPEDSVQSTGLNIAARCAQNEHDPLTEGRRFKAGLVVRDTELGSLIPILRKRTPGTDGDSKSLESRQIYCELKSLEDRIPNVRLAVELPKLAINAMCSGNRRHVRAAANGWVYRAALSHGFPENSTASGVSRLHLNSREVYKNIHRETVNLTEGGTDTHVLALNIGNIQCGVGNVRKYCRVHGRRHEAETRSQTRDMILHMSIKTYKAIIIIVKLALHLRDKVASRNQYGRNTRCSTVRCCPVESGAAHELRGSAWSEDGCLRDRKVRKITAQPGRSEIPWHGTYRAHPKLPTEHEDRKSGRLLPKRRGNATPQCAKDTLNYLRHRRYSVGDVGINLHAAEIGEPEGSRSILVAIAHENGGITWRFILTEKHLERGQCNRADSIGSAQIDIESGVCKFGEHEVLVELRRIQAVVRQRTKQAWNISQNCGPDGLSKTHNFAQLDADNAASAPEKREWVEISAHIALISKTQRTKSLVGLSFTFKTGRLYSPCNQVEMHGMSAEFNAVVEVKRECRVLNCTRSQLGVPVGGVRSRAEIHRHLVRVEFAVTWSGNQEVHPFQRMRLKTRNAERQTNDSGIQSSNESSMVRSQQRRTTEGSKDRVWLQKCSVINYQSNNSENNESSSFEMIICIAQADANLKFKDNPKGSQEISRPRGHDGGVVRPKTFDILSRVQQKCAQKSSILAETYSWTGVRSLEVGQIRVCTSFPRESPVIWRLRMARNWPKRHKMDMELVQSDGIKTEKGRRRNSAQIWFEHSENTEKFCIIAEGIEKRFTFEACLQTSQNTPSPVKLLSTTGRARSCLGKVAGTYESTITKVVLNSAKLNSHFRELKVRNIRSHQFWNKTRKLCKHQRDEPSGSKGQRKRPYRACFPECWPLGAGVRARKSTVQLVGWMSGTHGESEKALSMSMMRSADVSIRGTIKCGDTCQTWKFDEEVQDSVFGEQRIPNRVADGESQNAHTHLCMSTLTGVIELEIFNHFRVPHGVRELQFLWQGDCELYKEAARVQDPGIWLGNCPCC
ncbi:hypothetical protein K438DRAFT_1776383 [Mycena galopus ATCC 62051]|nr:hypothetical protein K438DRAFT_1776383 [Mycena galopus ATCC 62051]